MLRIVGTFIGCIAALVIIITMIRAPLLMLLVCSIWAGFCTWVSSLVRVENSYAWGCPATGIDYCRYHSGRAAADATVCR
jgi:uncharacterized membrane protein YccC